MGTTASSSVPIPPAHPCADLPTAASSSPLQLHSLQAETHIICTLMALQREDRVCPCICKAYKKLGDIFQEEENLWTLPHSGLGTVWVTWCLSMISHCLLRAPRLEVSYYEMAFQTEQLKYRWVTAYLITKWEIVAKRGKTARLITEINLKLRYNASGCAGCFPGACLCRELLSHTLQFSKCNLREPTPSLGLHLSVKAYLLEWVLTFMNLLGISGSLTSPLLLFNSFMWVYAVILWQTKCKGNIVWLDQNKTTQKLFWMQMIPFQLAFLSMRLGFIQHLSLFPMQCKYITWGSSGNCNQLSSKPFLYKCITVLSVYLTKCKP